jgi:DNA-binding PadR family transcriptional regulator
MNVTTTPPLPHWEGELSYKAYQPRAPRTVEEAGLSLFFVVELITKIFHRGGQLRLLEVAERSKLPIGVLTQVLDFMRNERMCEVYRRGETETDVTYTLTDLGRQRAEQYLQRSQYAGAAPVSLDAYLAQVQRQTITEMTVDREKVRQAFSGVVVNQRILDQFGAAMNSGRAIFVYGPAGAGKSFIAEKLVGLLSGYVFFPYAIAVDNEVIQVFDPLVHKPVDVSHIPVPEPTMGIDRRRAFDERWVLCHRPVVITGGELTLSMLDLEFDRAARFYNAPPQVKANNGLLIIDDLGRQLVEARDLMNRWIVPLDRRVDYLALHTGKKFSIPFDVTVVFSTNLAPSDLADEAFLRRLGYKIRIDALSEGEYREIFQQVCANLQIPFTEQGLEYVRHCHTRDNKPLLACIPRDILGQVRDRARYTGVKPELADELLEWAWKNYFVQD